MTQQENKVFRVSLAFLFSVGFAMLFSISLALLPLAVGAAETLSLSVTPPLFQLDIGPGEFWASSLKVINTNSYDLTLYAAAVNFEASGEVGQGKFVPLIAEDPETSGSALASWIEVSKDPIFVPKEKSAEIPFSVRIPSNVSPGGHYAAILVGTKPSVDAAGDGAKILVSSFVSSLFFVQIKGDVVEDGFIREFLAERDFYQKPEVNFTLRFENRGNTHLQPQGDIAIYNMWGKERGKIPVNQESNFGNVLPKSARKFDFEWKGEGGILEAGIYRAVATLAYGREARQNTSDTAYFWVVPLVPAASILGGLILFLLFAVWAIRVYIRRTIKLYQDTQ